MKSEMRYGCMEIHFTFVTQADKHSRDKKCSDISQIAKNLNKPLSKKDIEGK